jgi:hypothetical protein
MNAAHQPGVHVLITVRCFFDAKHTISSYDPKQAHRRLQLHYQEKHQKDLARLGYGS